MKVTLEFLSLPNVVKMVGSKTITVDLSGQTVGDLLGELASKYGAGVRKFLLDETGHLDMSLAMTINKELIRPDQTHRALREGDRITIMMLVAGG
jgi:sulfur carrier protein ThiS